MSLITNIDYMKKYTNFVKRRKNIFVLAFIFPLLLIISYIYISPSVYKTKATLLVEPVSIPDYMSEYQTTDFVEERIKIIAQYVLSRDNLKNISEKYNLFPEDMTNISTKDFLEKLRGRISIEPIQTEVTNTRFARTTQATIAFDISFEGKDPEKITHVVNDLVDKFIEQNSKFQAKKTDTAVVFLKKQLESLERQIKDMDKQIAKFKEKNLLALPEFMQINMSNIQDIERDIDEKKEKINQLYDRQAYLQRQLTTLAPIIGSPDGTQMTPAEQLKSLRSQYLAARAAHSSKHPDVVSLRKQVAALEEQVSATQQVRELKEELRREKEKLATLSQNYSAIHPDVIKTKKSLQEIDKKLQKYLTHESTTSENYGQEHSNNPSYMNVQMQLKLNEMEIESVKNELQALQKRRLDVLKHVEEAPQVEQQYNALLRDYKNAQEKYNEIMTRLQVAREAQELEKNQVVQKLRLIDPPVVPDEPFKPNRPLLALIGLMFSLGVGAGSMSVVEYFDDTIHLPQDLNDMGAQPLLGVVPKLETVYDKHKHIQNKIILLCILFGCICAGLYLTHIFYQPLDQLWSQMMQTIQAKSS